MASNKQLPKHAYNVGWICALPLEMAAACEMLDEDHGPLKNQSPLDQNSYRLGRIHQHNVVIACLPYGVYGTTSAATVATHMLRTFDQSLRVGLMVGIGGGVPSVENDMRLGDIVVSLPSATSGGLIQYDMGKLIQGGEFVQNGMLNRPPTALLTTLSQVRADDYRGNVQYPEYLSNAIGRCTQTQTTFSSPGPEKDILYEAEYDHHPEATACKTCEPSRRISRPPRESLQPKVHYGVIASGNTVMKHGITREKLRRKHGIICFEMEAAGLVSDFPCLVIRGICDYSDSHKNSEWQGYAAVVAAAYAKDFLSYLPEDQLQHTISIAKLSRALSHAEEGSNKGGQRGSQENDTEQVDETLQECIRAFKRADYEKFKNINPDPVLGTCKWVFNHARYTSWNNSLHDDLLWISADPGCGKSVLAKTLVDQVLPSESSRLICHYFFKDNEEQNNLSGAMCALLHQLFSAKPHLASFAIPAWMNNGSRIFDEVDGLWKIFLSAIRDPSTGPCIFVLDALDECKDGERLVLIDYLKRFQGSCPPGDKRSSLKFLVTSRPYSSIRQAWEDIELGISTIWLPGEDANDTIRQEINLVLEAEVEKLSKEKRLPVAVRDTLKSELQSMPHRTYLWLYLAIGHIRGSVSTKKTSKAYVIMLKKFPRTLDEAYEKILEKAEDEDQAKILLQIIVGANRPLTLRELNLAFEIALDEKATSSGDLDMEYETDFKERIRNLCGLFIFFNNSQVYLIHQTAKEFLLGQTRCPMQKDHKWKCSLAGLGSQVLMARICMQYLLFKDFNGGAIDPYGRFRKIKNSDFHGDIYEQFNEEFDGLFDGESETRSNAELATSLNEDPTEESITEQVRDSEDEHCDLAEVQLGVDPILFRFRELYKQTEPPEHERENERKDKIQDKIQDKIDDYNDGLLRYASSQWWIHYRDAEKAVGEQHIKMATSLHNTERDHHFLWIPYLLGLYHPYLGRYQAPQYLGLTGLHYAAYCGHETCVKSMSDNYLNIDRKDNFGRTPLMFSIAGSQEAMVEFLINNGAEFLDLQDVYQETPLSVASKLGHTTIAALVIRLGIDVNAKIRYGMTPLYFSKANDMIRLLIKNGSDVNTQDIDGNTVLHQAIRSFNFEKAELLLENKSDPYIHNKYGLDAFWSGAVYGGMDMVHNILKIGLDPGKCDLKAVTNYASERSPQNLPSLYGYYSIIEAKEFVRLALQELDKPIPGPLQEDFW